MARPGRRHSRDRPQARTGAVDDIPRAAAQYLYSRTYKLDYRASSDQRHAERRARRPKTAKLVDNTRLRAYVQDRLSGDVTDAGGNRVGPQGPAWKGRNKPHAGGGTTLTALRIDLRADRTEISTGTDLRLEYRATPYTGEVVETVGEQLLSLSEYVDGIPHGTDLEWWADGGRLTQGQMAHGVAVGIWRRWHHNGTLAVEKRFDSSGDLESTRSWDEQGIELNAPPS